MAPDDIVLNDDNWDQTLYEGGLRLLVAGSNTSSDQKVTTPPLHSLPHVDAVKREDYPLSKLFYLYLVISGKSKVDPEIVRWIVDFLTGPKKAYLIHLMYVLPFLSTDPSAVIPRRPSFPRTIGDHRSCKAG